MGASSGTTNPPRFGIIILSTILMIAAITAVRRFQAASAEPFFSAVFMHGVLTLTLPYVAARSGSGQLSVDVLNPEDRVVGHAEQRAAVSGVRMRPAYMRPALAQA